MRTLLAPIVVLLALGLTAIAVAKPSFPARVSIDSAFKGFEYVFSGKVRSDKQGCVTDRKVLLFNESLEDPIGSDRAKQSGAYEIRIDADGLQGDYYTKVRRLERSAYVCKADESRRLDVR